ncbi:MAG: type II restriction endonuclease [Bacteroidales bacterium]|nr:type II restriction endonuclease [Bacteroidales bacterium]
MKDNFNDFITQLSETNATLDYFTDFDKVSSNVRKIAIKLNQLNYLIGKEDLDKAIRELYEENPKTFDVLEILIAVRNKDNRKCINQKGDTVLISSYFNSVEGIIEYFEETGLSEVFKRKDVTNLVDYVYGVEVGLDTNARKNRGGDCMSAAVKMIFNNNKIKYRKEVSIKSFPEIISLGEDVKRFDFAIKTKKKTYLIEVNYYNGGGSKLNEVARAYSDVAPKINQYNNYEFVWITDGQGWHSAKNKLEEAYSIIPSVYNLNSISQFVNKVLEEEVIDL